MYTACHGIKRVHCRHQNSSQVEHTDVMGILFMSAPPQATIDPFVRKPTQSRPCMI
jgi:hypothetical protein